MNESYLLLGTNLGDKSVNLLTAIESIEANIGHIAKKSSIYRTKAWGKEDQGDFLNQVILVNTSINSEDLLKSCLDIEEEMGRVRKEKWGERLIDIDILYFGKEIIERKNLIVPHPELHNRRFTLIPLVEIAPQYIHPIKGITNFKLLEQCKDELDVIKE